MNNLLIGTATQLVCWDGEQHCLSNGNYYGITWDKDYIYCRHNPAHISISEIEIFNCNLERCGKLPFTYLEGVHQILSVEDELHITVTTRNRIDVYDGSQTMRSYNWSNTEGDRHHINSIFFKDNKFYVAESGLSGEKNPPAIQVLDRQYRPFDKFSMPAAIHIHNVYIEDGILYTCGKFGLVKMDLRRNKYTVADIRQDRENGFFRGLARSQKYWYIGESQVLPRKDRKFGDAKIQVLDNDLKHIDTITLKGTGQVQEIRIIDELDLAHNDISL